MQALPAYFLRKRVNAMAYATQMEAARNSVITKEMEAAAAKEGIAPAELMRQMAEGRAIIPCNKLHKSISPSAVGAALKTKINVNLGTSRDMTDMEMEFAKVKSAVAAISRRTVPR